MTLTSDPILRCGGRSNSIEPVVLTRITSSDHGEEIIVIVHVAIEISHFPIVVILGLTPRHILYLCPGILSSFQQSGYATKSTAFFMDWNEINWNILKFVRIVFGLKRTSQ